MTGSIARKSLGFVLISLLSFIVVYPILYLALGAFTSVERLSQTVLLPIPDLFDLSRVASAFTALRGAYLATLVRVVFYLIVTVAVGVLGGYILSKLRFPGRRVVFWLLLSGLVMPAILMMVPQYILAAHLPLVGGNDIFGQGGHGFIGEWPVLFMYGWVPPFAIFLIKQTLDMVPNDYEDAARVDGAGLFTLLWHVYGPLLRPVIAALVILTFLVYWNDYLWPSVTIGGSPSWYPISFALVGGGGSFGAPPANPDVFLYLLMALWPPAVVFFLLQRNFVQGLVASGLKG
jgi:multiple sugar transport system permease protein